MNKPKSKLRSEFVFSSPFTLYGCISRLRSKSKARDAKFNFYMENIDSETYFFRLTQRGWLPSTITGYMQRDGNHTLITGSGGVNWIPFLVTLTIGILLTFYQWQNVRAIFGEAVFMLLTESPLIIPFALIFLLPQIILLCGFIGLLRRFAFGHHTLAKQMEHTLVDVMTDLPNVNAVSDEDGELVLIEALPEEQEERLRRIES
jgi:hypothetical protein